mgnify:CR=1 FL=1
MNYYFTNAMRLEGDLMSRGKEVKELREKMGMVYSVGVSVGATQHPSALCRETISFSCLPNNVQALVDSTFLVIGNMCDDPDSFSGELEDVKTNLIKDWKITKQRSFCFFIFVCMNKQ